MKNSSYDFFFYNMQKRKEDAYQNLLKAKYLDKSDGSTKTILEFIKKL